MLGLKQQELYILKFISSRGNETSELHEELVPLAILDLSFAAYSRMEESIEKHSGGTLHSFKISSSNSISPFEH